MKPRITILTVGDSPDRDTYNILQCMIKKIIKLNKNEGLRYEKIHTA